MGLDVVVKIEGRWKGGRWHNILQPYYIPFVKIVNEYTFSTDSLERIYICGAESIRMNEFPFKRAQLSIEDHHSLLQTDIFHMLGFPFLREFRC